MMLKATSVLAYNKKYFYIIMMEFRFVLISRSRMSQMVFCSIKFASKTNYIEILHAIQACKFSGIPKYAQTFFILTYLYTQCSLHHFFYFFMFFLFLCIQNVK